MKIYRFVCTLAVCLVSFYAYNLIRMNFYAYNFIRLQDSAVSTENMAKSKAQATTSPPPLQPHPKGLTIIVPIQDASLAVTIKKKGIPVAPKMVKHVTALETSSVVANEKKRLQTILDNIHVETGRPYPGNLWEVSEYMPEWMKEYFAWHKQERLIINESNWTSHRFLVMQCLDFMDNSCGGSADRLKPFLMLLREAHKSKRLLFIHWNRPARLEEFLVPPRGGMDWRAPPFLETLLHDKNNGVRPFNHQGLLQLLPAEESLVRSRYQSVTGGAEHYDKKLGPGESTFEEVYHDAWRILFTPSKPVRQEVEQNMNKMELVPGEFVAAHLRALYGRRTVETRLKETVVEWTHNALNCASQLRPGGPFFFASDHPYAIEVAQSYGVAKSTKIVARKHERRPHHFEKAEKGQSLQPSDYYDTFVDLLLIGMGKCANFNRGGFGQWGGLIGFNSSCVRSQKTSVKGIGVMCNWTEGGEPSELDQGSKAPWFLDPLEDGEAWKLSEPKREIIATGISEATMTGNISSNLPKWMTEDYFAWRKKTRRIEKKSNYWNSEFNKVSHPVLPGK